MSYEQIAATLKQNGLKISPAGVGVLCRGYLTRAGIERVRREQVNSSDSTQVVSSRSAAPSVPKTLGPWGPRITRDDY